MPKDGFSIDDLLNPKPRAYNPEQGSPRYRQSKMNSGRKAARLLLKELKLSSVPIDLEPVCRHFADSTNDRPAIPKIVDH